MNKARIFEHLIGQTITKIDRLTVIENNDVENDSVALSDTLIFTLSDGSCYEILVTSENTVLKKVKNKQDFAINFSLEENETINLKPISEKIKVPFVVASIIETWAGKDNLFLVAVDFLDQNKQSLMSILTETDGIDILKSEEIKAIISRMIFDYGFITHEWYPS